MGIEGADEQANSVAAVSPNIAALSWRIFIGEAFLRRRRNPNSSGYRRGKPVIGSGSVFVLPPLPFFWQTGGANRRTAGACNATSDPSTILRLLGAALKKRNRRDENGPE